LFLRPFPRNRLAVEFFGFNPYYTLIFFSFDPQVVSSHCKVNSHSAKVLFLVEGIASTLASCFLVIGLQEGACLQSLTHFPFRRIGNIGFFCFFFPQIADAFFSFPYSDSFISPQYHFTFTAYALPVLPFFSDVVAFFWPVQSPFIFPFWSLLVI